MAVDSLIGYVPGALTDPAAVNPSKVGFVTATLNRPHHPVGVFDGTTVRYVPLLVWDGTALR